LHTFITSFRAKYKVETSWLRTTEEELQNGAHRGKESYTREVFLPI